MDDDARADLELTLVVGRRPELLRRTLASFGPGMLRHFRLTAVHANIDPVFGDAADARACREILRGQFPEVQIGEPDRPGFCAAVIRLWSATRGRLVLHLEDDWLLASPVTPADVLPLMTDGVGSVRLVSKELDWDGHSPFSERRRKRRLLSLPLGTRRLAIFGTSPCFLDGPFARGSARLMDPGLDPEKQMRKGRNPALEDFQQRFRCRLLPGPGGTELITDIGREWRDGQGITKTTVGGRSIWEER